MRYCIHPHKLSGSTRAIPSKSMAHRILISAALSDRETYVDCSQTSDDIRATVRCLSALGAIVRHHSHAAYSILPLQDHGTRELPCGESGTTLRFLLPIVAALGKSVTFTMEGRLPQRPLAPLTSQLQQHGITLEIPVSEKLVVSGKLQPGNYVLPGDVSSQFISGMLMALPLLREGSVLTVTGRLESASYVDMTLQVLRDFGVCIQRQGNQFYIPPSKYVSPGRTNVEGDWSSASNWLAASALGSNIQITGLNPHSQQGDKTVVDILQVIGGNREIDVSNIPDLVPILAVVASVSSGSTHFIHAGRLRLKESDRIQSTAEMIRNLGGTVSETGSSLLITGATLKGGLVDSAGDHRIAMAAAIAATVCQESVVLDGAQFVKKSYPNFWRDFSSLGGIVEEVSF